MQPIVADEAIAARLRDTVQSIFARLDEQPRAESVCVDVVVGWHKTAAPAGAERVARPASPDRLASPANAERHYAVFHSPYSWLASALAGTRQVRDETRERPTNRLLTRDAAHDEKVSDTFEQWVLSLQVHYGASDGADASLETFATSALAFANAHQAQLPAILDAGLCPFPFTIDSTVRT